MNNHGSSAESSLRSDPDPSLRAPKLDVKRDAPSFQAAVVHDISPPCPPVPSFKLLFSFSTPRPKLVLLTPAIASSVAAGGLAPFLSYVVGQSFNTFASFPLTPNPMQAAKDALLHGVGFAALELVGLGSGALIRSDHEQRNEQPVNLDRRMERPRPEKKSLPCSHS